MEGRRDGEQDRWRAGETKSKIDRGKDRRRAGYIEGRKKGTIDKRQEGGQDRQRAEGRAGQSRGRAVFYRRLVRDNRERRQCPPPQGRDGTP